MKNENLRFIVLLLGLGALVVNFALNISFLSLIMGLSAIFLKINMAKNGYTNIIATIGSYSGVIASVISIFDLIL